MAAGGLAGERIAEGQDEISRIFEITKGYADEDIKKILGLNFLRVFREAGESNSWVG